MVDANSPGDLRMYLYNMSKTSAPHGGVSSELK